MTHTLRHAVVLLLAAVVGAAFAAGYGSSTNTSTTSATATSNSGIVSQALARTRVSLFTAEPGTPGATKIVSAAASTFVDGAVTKDIGHAAFAMFSVRRPGVSLGRRDAVFAVASAASAKNLELAVAGVPGSTRQDEASLSVLATYLYNAVQGTEPAVLLERGRGARAVAFAVYDPALPAGTMKASGADEAVLIINGRVRTYRVQASGQAVKNLVIASGKHKGQQLGAVIG